jgi:catechol 2,3-dioxygenase-like lactoylglutathione lyase family enzyme
MAEATDLDHLAVAAESWDELWPRYAGDLGGRWLAGGPGPGFASAQVRYANGMKVEALSPYAVEVNDFLRRFLDARGPGPHHLTFKVPDIEAALERAAGAGYRPVGVDLRDPTWKEAFLHPKDAPGVVVQLAEAEGEWESPAPDGFPPARVDAATFDYVGHGIADLDDGLRLFAGLLEGDECGRGHDELLSADWVELRWPGPGRVRLFTATEASSTVSEWIGAAAGRLHHLAFTVAQPEAVADAKPTGDGRYEVPPESNLGTRLMLR